MLRIDAPFCALLVAREKVRSLVAFDAGVETACAPSEFCVVYAWA
jgi:hypothetical protein